MIGYLLGVVHHLVVEGDTLVAQGSDSDSCPDCGQSPHTGVATEGRITEDRITEDRITEDRITEGRMH